MDQFAQEGQGLGRMCGGEHQPGKRDQGISGAGLAAEVVRKNSGRAICAVEEKIVGLSCGGEIVFAACDKVLASSEEGVQVFLAIGSWIGVGREWHSPEKRCADRLTSITKV